MLNVAEDFVSVSGQDATLANEIAGLANTDIIEVWPDTVRRSRVQKNLADLTADVEIGTVFNSNKTPTNEVFDVSGLTASADSLLGKRVRVISGAGALDEIAEVTAAAAVTGGNRAHGSQVRRRTAQCGPGRKRHRPDRRLAACSCVAQAGAGSHSTSGPKLRRRPRCSSSSSASLRLI